MKDGGTLVKTEGEGWLDSGSVLKRETLGLADGLDLGSVGRMGSRTS